MYDAIIIRYGEIGLKKGNRKYFENALINNILKSVPGIRSCDLSVRFGRIFLELTDEYELESLLEQLSKVFGIVSISPAQRLRLSKDSDRIIMDELKEKGTKLLIANRKANHQSFRVATRRADKDFPFKSPQVNREVGAHILSLLPDLKVDLTEPDISLNIEIRFKDVYFYTDTIKGLGGLPIGVSGHGLLLLSGGIDSPVAGYMMMKRGLKVSAIYFHSFPFTSERETMKIYS